MFINKTILHKFAFAVLKIETRDVRQVLYHLRHTPSPGKHLLTEQKSLLTAGDRLDGRGNNLFPIFLMRLNSKVLSNKIC